MVMRASKIAVKLRMDRKLRKRLQLSAKHENLSLNQEAVRRLEESFQGDRLANIEKMLNDIRKSIKLIMVITAVLDSSPVRDDIIKFLNDAFTSKNEETVRPQRTSDTPVPAPDAAPLSPPH